MDINIDRGKTWKVCAQDQWKHYCQKNARGEIHQVRKTALKKTILMMWEQHMYRGTPYPKT